MLPITVNINVCVKNDKPYITLTRGVQDSNLIKIILTSAFTEKPIIIQPVFSNKFKLISSLIEKGICFENEKKEIKFLI